jgi:hypothetical protein
MIEKLRLSLICSYHTLLFLTRCLLFAIFRALVVRTANANANSSISLTFETTLLKTINACVPQSVYKCPYGQFNCGDRPSIASAVFAAHPTPAIPSETGADPSAAELSLFSLVAI